MYRPLIASVNNYMRTTAVARFGCCLACLLLFVALARAEDPPVIRHDNPSSDATGTKSVNKGKRRNKPRANGTNAPQATAAEALTVLPGFKVELLRSAAVEEGSWICMTVDQK